MYAYDTKLVEEEKQQFVVGKLKSEQKTKVTDFMEEIAYLIFSATPSIKKNIKRYQQKVMSFMGLNVVGEDFYFLTPRSTLTDLRKIINNGGKINNKPYLYDLDEKV